MSDGGRNGSEGGPVWSKLALGFGAGLALGPLFGIALDNLAVGIGFGLAIGIVLSIALGGWGRR